MGTRVTSTAERTGQLKDLLESKRVAFHDALFRILARAKGSLNLLFLKQTVGQDAKDVLEIIRAEAFDETEATQLLSRTFTLLNVFASQSGEPAMLAEVILATIPSDFPLHASVLHAAGWVIAPAAKAILFERSIERMFASTPADWEQVKERLQMQPSDLDINDVISACSNSRSFLTLYAYSLLRLQRCQSFRDEVNVTSSVQLWVNMFDPKVAAGGEKLLLFMPFLLSLTMSQWAKEPGLDVAFKACFDKLVDLSSKMMTDRDGDGFLGFIGFGSKSPHSPRLRVVARIAHACLLAQNGERGVFNRRITPRTQLASQASLNLRCSRRA